MNKSILTNLKSSGNQRIKSLLKINPALLGEISDAKIFNNIAYELLTLRRESNLTQRELADRIQLKQSHISRWEQPGYQGYKVKILSKLARTMGGSLKVSLLPPKSNTMMFLSFTQTRQEINNTLCTDGASITKTKIVSNSVTINVPIEGVLV